MQSSTGFRSVAFLSTIKPQHNISLAADDECITSASPNVLVRIALQV